MKLRPSVFADAKRGRIAAFCRDHGCQCADDCPHECYLLTDAAQEDGDFDIHADDRHNDPRTGQAKDLNR